MPPTTRSRTSPPVLPTQPDAIIIHPPSNSDSDSDSHSIYSASPSEEDDDDSPLITSPSNLLYNLSHLPPEQQTIVKEAFNDPPQIALQQCRKIDGTYAFQMTELVTRSIRIHDNDGASRLRCSCQEEDDGSCPHLIWLLDKMVQQMLYEHDGKVLSMNERGYAEELGDPYAAISSHHLDILAAGLHCPVMDPTNQINPTRALEARELLSSIYGQHPEVIPTISNKTANPIRKHDLEQTIFQMLVDNSHFFTYFHSHTQATDAINDPFRKIRQRVDLVLESLDDPTDSRSTVPWAARHILGCVHRIRAFIYNRDKPLSSREASSATSTLIYILTATIDRSATTKRETTTTSETSLYHHLIGDQDHGFAISTLELLPQAASPFLYVLEELLERVSLLGVPASYVDKFRALCGRLRRARVGSGGKRRSEDEGGQRTKRVR